MSDKQGPGLTVKEHIAIIKKRYIAGWVEVNSGKRGNELIPVWTRFNEEIANLLKDLDDARNEIDELTKLK